MHQSTTARWDRAGQAAIDATIAIRRRIRFLLTVLFALSCSGAAGSSRAASQHALPDVSAAAAGRVADREIIPSIADDPRLPARPDRFEHRLGQRLAVAGVASLDTPASRPSVVRLTGARHRPFRPGVETIWTYLINLRQYDDDGEPTRPVRASSDGEELRLLHDQERLRTATALEALRLLRPYQLQDARKVRVGREYDGGYVMVDRFEGISAAYSLGINDDVSWDLEMAGKGIPVFQYDHTIAGLPEQHPLFRWEPRRIHGTADPDNGVESLESLVARNGHEGNRDLLLKCDIEGSEWPLLQQTPSHILAQFRQIVLEVHNMGFLAEEPHADNVRLAFSNLTRSHRVVHVHANNYSPFSVAGGVPFPTTMELTLVRSDEGVLLPSSETFPTAMDMPCNPDAADLYLGHFIFG